MNWGYKILIAYCVFVLGILFLVIKSSNEKEDLVTPDYYAQELKYQQKIDETSRTNTLTAPLQVTIKSQQVVISFPKDFSGKKVTGNVLLYCPSDEDKDIKQNFSVQDTDVIIPIPAVNRGLFEVQISWEADGLKYYYNKKITI